MAGRKRRGDVHGLASGGECGLERQTSAAQPSFFGYVRDADDAHFVFESARLGQCRIIRERLNHKRDHIAAGHGYVYDEENSNIRRWTDGYNWSDSYHPGGKVLIYKQVDVVSSNGRTVKIELPNGLRKKTIADPCGPYRIVCYYFEADEYVQQPVRLVPPDTNDIAEARAADSAQRTDRAIARLQEKQRTGQRHQSSPGRSSPRSPQSDPGRYGDLVDYESRGSIKRYAALDDRMWEAVPGPTKRVRSNPRPTNELPYSAGGSPPHGLGYQRRGDHDDTWSQQQYCRLASDPADNSTAHRDSTRHPTGWAESRPATDDQWQRGAADRDWAYASRHTRPSAAQGGKNPQPWLPGREQVSGPPMLSRPNSYHSDLPDRPAPMFPARTQSTSRDNTASRHMPPYADTAYNGRPEVPQRTEGELVHATVRATWNSLPAHAQAQFSDDRVYAAPYHLDSATDDDRKYRALLPVSAWY